MRSVLFGLLQLAGGVAALAGLYLLVGLAWTLLVGGAVALAGFTLLEMLAAPRPAEPAAPEPAPVSELEGLRSPVKPATVQMEG
jgi:hypothetical protein